MKRDRIRLSETALGHVLLPGNLVLIMGLVLIIMVTLKYRV